MKNKLTLNDLVNYVQKICPNVIVACEADGNIVLVTNLRETVNSHGLVDIDTGEYQRFKRNFTKG